MGHWLAIRVIQTVILTLFYCCVINTQTFRSSATSPWWHREASLQNEESNGPMLSGPCQRATKLQTSYCLAPNHWKAPSMSSPVRLESMILASGMMTPWTPACLVPATAVAVLSSGSVWFLPSTWLQAEWETWPLSVLFYCLYSAAIFAVFPHLLCTVNLGTCVFL